MLAIWKFLKSIAGRVFELLAQSITHRVLSSISFGQAGWSTRQSEPTWGRWWNKEPPSSTGSTCDRPLRHRTLEGEVPAYQRPCARICAKRNNIINMRSWKVSSQDGFRQIRSYEPQKNSQLFQGKVEKNCVLRFIQSIFKLTAMATCWNTEGQGLKKNGLCVSIH